MIIRYMFLILALGWLTGCNYPCPQCTYSDLPDNPYHHNNFENQFNPRYTVTPTVTSKSGIAVDLSGLELLLDDVLDRQVAEVESCLKEVLGIESIHRGWLIVKVVPDAFLSIDGSQELIPGSGHPEECVAKKLCSSIESCDCYLRAGIQDNSVIIVTPSMYLLKDPLIRTVSGINNPWVGNLAKCAMPTVPKTSGLVTK